MYTFIMQAVEAQSAISTLYCQCVSSPFAIHNRTSIPLQTIDYNLRKIRGTGAIQDRPQSGQPRNLGLMTMEEHLSPCCHEHTWDEARHGGDLLRRERGRTGQAHMDSCDEDRSR